MYAAVGAASFSGGVLLGGVLAQLMGWRSVLWFSVVLGLAVLAATRAGLPDGVGRGGRLDLPGAVSGTLGLFRVSSVRDASLPSAPRPR